MNGVFFGIVAVAYVFAALLGTPDAVGKAALSGAKSAVELAIGLSGYIVLFLGLMKVVEEAGGLAAMARVVRPVMVRLFPDIPADHPAMGAMIMNVAANALGLGNAATPFGLKAMKELAALNRREGVASNAMVLFLAINTSGLALLPTGVIGLRAEAGSVDPAAIFPTTLFATACSTVVGVLAARLLSRLPRFALDDPPTPPPPSGGWAEWRPTLLFAAALVALVGTVYVGGEAVSAWILPTLIFGMLLFGVLRKVPVYEVFIAGAREGFGLALGLIPYLVAILSAVGMLRASGGLEKITFALGALTGPLGLPAEVLPLALLRPLSGSGAFALTADLVKTHGPDSVIGQLASTLNGSTETTFYVLAVYFGSVGVSRTRHAVAAGLAADLTGVVASVLAVRLLL